MASSQQIERFAELTETLGKEVAHCLPEWIESLRDVTFKNLARLVEREQ